MDVQPRTNAKMPFMLLFEDGAKRVVGSVRRPISSATFEIQLAGESGDLGIWKPMQRTGDKDGTWTAELPGGDKEVAWQGSVNVAGSRYTLVGMSATDKDEVLAEFKPAKGLSACGVLQMNVDGGAQFDQEAIMTFMCLYDRISVKGTNSLGWGSTGFE